MTRGLATGTGSSSPTHYDQLVGSELLGAYILQFTMVSEPEVDLISSGSLVSPWDCRFHLHTLSPTEVLWLISSEVHIQR